MPDVLRIATTYRAELETEIAKLDKFIEFAGDLMAGTATAIPSVSLSTGATADIDLPEPTLDLTEAAASEPDDETQSEQLAPADEPEAEMQSEQLAPVEEPEADSTDTDPSADPEDLDKLREKLDDLRATLSTPTASRASVEEADADGRVLLANGRPSLFRRATAKNCDRQAVAS